MAGLPDVFTQKKPFSVSNKAIWVQIKPQKSQKIPEKAKFVTHYQINFSPLFIAFLAVPEGIKFCV